MGRLRVRVRFSDRIGISMGRVSGARVGVRVSVSVRVRLCESVAADPVTASQPSTAGQPSSNAQPSLAPCVMSFLR